MSRPIVVPRFAARLAAILAVGTVAVALAACGEETVDQESLESGLLALAQETADVESVSCPDDVSPDDGTEFECVVTNASGEEVPVVAIVTGEDGDDVLFEVQSIDGVDVSN
jgi:hypothetical protein